MYIRKRDIELVRREYGHLKHMMFQNKSDSETFVKFVLQRLRLSWTMQLMEVSMDRGRNRSRGFLRQNL